MEYARRGPKRICSHMIRPSALSAMDILYSKICIDKAIAFLTAYMVGDDEDDTSLAYLSIGISYLQQYTYRNTKSNFPPFLLPATHNHLQYDIQSQPEGTFHVNFGRLSKIQAMRVNNILRLPILMTTENRFTFASELGLLIFLK